MKVIFLDVDGVLNSGHLADTIGWGGHFDESEKATHENVKWGQQMVDNLRKIVETTGSQIVISSTWRLHFSIPKFKEMFSIYGWSDAPIIDKTPVMISKRGFEINKWLVNHPEVNKYVILDDSTDFLPDQIPVFINTDLEVGLSKEDAEKAIKILSNE